MDCTIVVVLVLIETPGCGVQLRQDDPSSLKDIVQSVQAKVSLQTGTRSVCTTSQSDNQILTDTCARSSRTKFMIETLNNLKNNKIRQQQQNSGGAESKERIVKFVSGIGRKYHGAYPLLLIDLSFLMFSDTKCCGFGT